MQHEIYINSQKWLATVQPQWEIHKSIEYCVQEYWQNVEDIFFSTRFTDSKLNK